METGRCNYIDEQGNLCLAISYEDKDGNKKHITEIIASSILVLNKKKTTEENSAPQTPTSSTPNTEVPATQIDDDLPF